MKVPPSSTPIAAQPLSGCPSLTDYRAGVGPGSTVGPWPGHAARGRRPLLRQDFGDLANSVKLGAAGLAEGLEATHLKKPAHRVS